MIRRGYDRRHRHLWSATRWETYHIMSATVGSKGLRDAGIHNITDLQRFPWEKEEPIEVSQEDIDRLQKDMEDINAGRAFNPFAQ